MEQSIEDRIIDSVFAGKNAFVMGSGGVGKSVLFKSMNLLLKEDTVCVGSTGVSATNIEGCTAHKIFGIPIGIPTEADYNKARKNINKYRKLFNPQSPIKRIFFDEISMCRADAYIWIDWLLKECYRNNLPFGGLQFVKFGDLFQLGAVVKPEERSLLQDIYGTSNFFDTDVYNNSETDIFHMTKVYRQSNPELIKHLQNIRVYGSMFNLQQSLDYFNDLCLHNKIDSNDYLVTTNKKADELNLINYNKIKEKEFVYKADYSCFDSEPAPKVLKLKKGCRVIILVNHPEGEYNNGTKGYITSLAPDYICVRTDDGKDVVIKKNKWTSYDYKTVKDKLVKKERGYFSQIAVKLAYAITSHRAQGVTLESAIIDLGPRVFAPAIPYVCLSRVKTVERISLTRPIRKQDIITDKYVFDFAKRNNLI